MERAWNQASGKLVWPMLSRTNYQEWSAHVQCNLKAMYLWDAIESDKVERRRDRLARFGHLNFRALRDLGVKEMVEGLPLIRKVEQVCDGCALGKQHRTPFPQASAWRAS